MILFLGEIRRKRESIVWMGGWIFVGLILFSLAARRLTVRVKNPALAQERWKERADTKAFDRVFIARTAHEDLTLQRELPGYSEYTRRTRYRLVPGFW